MDSRKERWARAIEKNLEAREERRRQWVASIERMIGEGMGIDEIQEELGILHRNSMRERLARAGRDDLVAHFFAPSRSERAAMNRQALIEDFEELAEQRRGTAEIVTRVGYERPASLARQLVRAGRKDLAVGLWSKQPPTSAQRLTVSTR